MTRALVNPGVCGMTAAIEVTKTDKRRVGLEITSECEKVINMGKTLSELDRFNALKPHVDSDVYKSASERQLCPSCPVPMAILKAIEVETGLALPRSVTLQWETTD